jgi:DNA invertase Pin-like site-specific DNA recombinase
MSTTSVASSSSGIIRVHIRVSSDSQNLDSQRHAADRWLTAFGDGREVLWYLEDGVMGDAKERPERDRLLREVQPGDTVLCFAIDRIGRDGIVGVLSIWKDFEARGVRLVSLCEPWADSSNPAAELIIAVLAWAAQQEKRKIKARARAGMDAKRARGEKWGGSKKGRRIKLDENKERRALRLLAKGDITPPEIGRIVGLSKNTIYRLRDRKGCGVGSIAVAETQESLQ